MTPREISVKITIATHIIFTIFDTNELYVRVQYM